MTGCKNHICDRWAGKYHIDGCQYATPGTFYIDYKFDLENMRNETRRVTTAFEKGVEFLIESNKLTRADRAGDKEFFCPVDWALEMCTIHVNPGRRCGKSTFIKNKFDPMLDIIIVPTLEMANRVKYELHGQYNNNIHALEAVLNNQLDGFVFTTIWMDEIGFYKHLDIYQLYRKLVRSGIEQTFIRFGR